MLFFSLQLYRHGDRTPINPYPNDPYKNNSFWPVPWGELTDAGKRGHFELGKWLRETYKDLLPRKYHSKDIHIRSTDVDRTLMSAYSNLAGLYLPDKDSNWNPNVLWDPIPVHTVPETLDRVVAGKAWCPKYAREKKSILKNEFFQKIDEENKKLYEYLSQESGAKVTNVIDVFDIYDTLFIEERFKFKLPQWTNKVYPEPLKRLGSFSFMIPCFTREMARLKMGPLFAEILGNMNKKIKGNLTQKAWMYSAHDTTVADFLQALGIFQPHSPPYLSLILVEMLKKNNEYFVTIQYRNSSSVPPYLMELPGCTKYCPMDTFRKILSDLIPEDWDEECQDIEGFVQNLTESMNSVRFVTVVSLGILLFLSIMIAMKYYRQHRWSQTHFAYTILKMDSTS
ncbi:hypothetical protein RUM44_001489 [Polyplax serrata]|uniref:acid phosphatase n=1 Tax=Polyplax serrata TaxID=468196 RepID=A0ABR1AKV3_POLSC